MAADESERLVFGYIRVEEPDEIEIALMREEMADYCKTNGLRLSSVCCDRGSDGIGNNRPGFTAALDVLALPMTYGLVVPALGHLSPEETVREELVQLIKRTGSKLLVLHAPNGVVDARDEAGAP